MKYSLKYSNIELTSISISRGGISIPPAALANGLVPDDRTDALENVTRTIGNLLDGYDIRLRPNFGGKNIRFLYILIKMTTKIKFTERPLRISFTSTVYGIETPLLSVSCNYLLDQQGRIERCKEEVSVH